VVEIFLSYLPCGCHHDANGRVVEYCARCEPLRLFDYDVDHEMFLMAVYCTATNGVPISEMTRYLSCRHRFTLRKYLNPSIDGDWFCAKCDQAYMKVLFPNKGYVCNCGPHAEYTHLKLKKRKLK